MKNRIYRLWREGYLYIVVACFLYALYGSNERIGIYDWQKEVAYFAYIKTSLRSFRCLPLFWWSIPDNVSWYPSVAHTSNFIGNPETMLFSPLLPLILLMDVTHYVKILSVIHFVVGVIGLLMLRRQLRWDDLQFRTYSSLFLFSPIVIQHLAIGYTPWLNLFLFPWLVYFIAHRRLLSSCLGVSAVLSLTLLQGGIHVFIWFAIFFVLYGFFCAFIEREWFHLLRILIVTSVVPLLSFVRIYTTAQAYGDFHQAFQTGYNPLNFLAWALIPPILTSPFDSFFVRKVWLGVPSWDGGIFWGLSVLMFAVVVIKYKSYRRNTEATNAGMALNYDSVLASASILLFLSFGSVFQLLVRGINLVVHIPFSEGAEKYPFRLAIPSFLGYSLLAAHFSANIWETVNSWICRDRLRGMLSPLTNVVTYLSLALGVGISLALIASVIFPSFILSAPMNMIEDAYYGEAHQWLSQMMEGKKTLPLQHYRAKLEAVYVSVKNGLLIALLSSLLTFLGLRNRARIQSFLEGSPYAMYEFALAIPLLFASAVWLSLAISVPFRNYPIQNMLPPKILTHPSLANFEPTTIVTPEKLVIYPREGSRVAEYTIPNISPADAKFLTVASENALLSESHGALAVVLQGTGPVVLEFKTTDYKRALRLTVMAWIGWIGTCTAITVRRKGKKGQPYVA